MSTEKGRQTWPGREGGLDNAFAESSTRMVAAASGLPEVWLTTTHGTPSLKVGKKLLARLREPDVLAIYVRDEAEKFGLIEAAPEIYATTPHFDGYAMVLARLSAISDPELALRMRFAWEQRSTPTILKKLGRQD